MTESIPVKFSRLGADLLTSPTGEQQHPADVQRGDTVKIGPLTVSITKSSAQNIKSSYLTYHFEGITVPTPEE